MDRNSSSCQTLAGMGVLGRGTLIFLGMAGLLSDKARGEWKVTSHPINWI